MGTIILLANSPVLRMIVPEDITTPERLSQSTRRSFPASDTLGDGRDEAGQKGHRRLPVFCPTTHQGEVYSFVFKDRMLYRGGGKHILNFCLEIFGLFLTKSLQPKLR